MADALEYELTESVATTLRLTPTQAVALRNIGERLASQRKNSPIFSTNSSVECSTTDGIWWRIRVVDAIGVIALPESIRLVILPKIPTSHLLYLFRVGGWVPRSTPTTANFTASRDLQSLIASWFLASLESLIKSGLQKSYVTQRDALPIVRGRIDAPRTVLDMMRGHVKISTEYDEFTHDIPINRVLAAAVQQITRSKSTPDDLRRRGRNTLYQLGPLSAMKYSDLHIEADRSTERYAQSLQLARLVLSNQGAGFEEGDNMGSSFLLSTPHVVESSLRKIIAQALEEITFVNKGRLRLLHTSMTVNPDLVFGNKAVGDIKYKKWEGSWNRADLYQLLAFSVAYERQVAVHIGFGGGSHLKPLRVGNVDVWKIGWNSDEDVLPAAAAETFKMDIRRWWRTISRE